ncbi:MAG: STAS domain-containing protein [Pyrinomonadaceae bacterium]
MSNLTITKRHGGGVAILDLVGKIRIGEGNLDLHRSLRAMVEQNEKKVLLNLAGISSIDSSGLGELVAGYATLERSGGELKLLNLTERVNELMVITKLLTVFDVFDDEASAIASFKPDLERTTEPLDDEAVTHEATA